ncbi:hypothetical protein [Thermoplasma volcanium GSS1]|uniref:Uncharacterized protein n=1 Tax=Thermoplasma volcanium (strain ATCC 51530 / DSM 4299 / JCM 9571 / NBRC 15438 / GSS1) TaxID=273116 RepID=Q97B04_THEVO|nr:ribbon-helix-helix domain-containing protein [Thermoplasma volcanium]BAB59797.1 hypothetical protein [Thermoplasma volcanium GSS1]
MLNKDVKLTLRISEEEINEIDEFLNLNPEFGSRSEFIRHAVMQYISSKRISVVKDDLQKTHEGLILDENSKLIIKTAIENGFFKDENDLISAVLRESLEPFVLKFVKKKSKNMSDLMKALASFENFKQAGATARKDGR